MRPVWNSPHSATRLLDTLLLLWMVPASPAAPTFPQQAESPAAALGKIMSIAESQHEIVMILVRKKEFEKAAAEANKIFEMKWPADKEALLLKELLYLSDQFLHHGRAAVGIGLLDSNTKAFKTNESLAAIWKDKGYLYKRLKNDDKALECFREAQRLEKQR